MGDPGWSNDWWGRDPIEQAGDPFEGILTEEDERECEAYAESLRQRNKVAFDNLNMLINMMRGWR